MNKEDKIIIKVVISAIFIIIVLIIYSLYTSLVLNSYQSRLRPLPCFAFSTREAAQQALKKGDVGLDKNKDGVACNNQFI